MFYIREKDLVSFDEYFSSDHLKKYSKGKQVGFGQFHIQVQGYRNNQIFSVITLDGPKQFYCLLEDLVKLKGLNREFLIRSLSNQYNIVWTPFLEENLVLKFTLVLEILGKSHKYLMLERYNSECSESKFVGNFCALLTHATYKWYYGTLIKNSISSTASSPPTLKG